MALRFEDYQIRLFVDDVEHGPISVTDFNCRESRRIDSATYMGKKDPHKDSSKDGWTVTFSLEVSKGDADLERAHEAYDRGQDRKDGTGRTEMVVAKRKFGVQTDAHRFYGIQWTLDESVADKGRARFSFSGEAERRVRV